MHKDDGPILLIAIISYIAIIAYRKYSRKHRSIDIAGSPVLTTFYTDGAEMLPVAKGTIGDMHFTAIIDSSTAPDGPPSSLLYRVELPFYSTLHLVAIPKQSNTVQIDPLRGNSIMERVNLEGDFPDYFNMFCEKGMQTDAREAMDPKAMAFVVDFCQSHSWEIVENELYFVESSGQHAKDDPTFMQDDIIKFVAEIRPAVERPLTKQEEAEITPYGEDRRNLKCPLCRIVLKNNDDYYFCPNNHGFLMTGAKLEEFHKGKLKLPSAAASPTKRPDTILTCPSCGSKMEHVAYDGGKPEIDSCPSCSYRWLDANEATDVSKNANN